MIQVTLVIPVKGTLQVTRLKNRYTQVRIYIHREYAEQLLRFVNKDTVVDALLIIQGQELQGGES